MLLWLLVDVMLSSSSESFYKSKLKGKVITWCKSCLFRTKLLPNRGMPNRLTVIILIKHIL